MLRNEIGLAGQQVARWESADTIEGDGIFHDVVASSYVELQRFQNADGDCEPHRNPQKSAISYVHDAARQYSSVGHHLERYPKGLAHEAGWHMRGLTKSSFVSLAKDGSNLPSSQDPWARRIAESTARLHTYMVPRAMIWTPQGIMSSIRLGANEISGSAARLLSKLSEIPTQETEVLFLGANLGDYRTASEPNPYRGAPGE
ncbi:hypothetical protein NLM33_34840 [Bradyrhizobium sp. CCGUVB1N3]|uniref:hypothetical protein n=1 Tax=Bradyrhizobium sp. CCGUVB1N3 TaxID=2949629 RepID=UPI0020B35529|nr:hypothetical protein [Bradyrhizobium sp. CCGUVB1N3]MCP3475481.1 hypothetical protein [Bradyrhizobium sp. CCGUVB1N3]